MNYELHVMKKSIYIAALSMLIYSCSGSQSEGTTDTTTGTDISAASRQPEADTNANDIGTNRSDGNAQAASFTKGKELIGNSDCLSCHKENEKVIGPSYQEVAKKYSADSKNVEYLAGKIISGGSGVWGEVPMTPHPAISKEDAAEMARYILSVR
jgi:cytochrome c